MTEDARFEDGRETPLNLGAVTPEDLAVLSALCQDAVLVATEMRWLPRERRFVMLLNRFRWEDAGARAGRHAPERVQSLLSFDNVETVASQGLARTERDSILSVLSMTFEPADAPAGAVILTLAGDGALRLRVEALEARLRDVTRPYRAVSRRTPGHPD